MIDGKVKSPVHTHEEAKKLAEKINFPPLVYERGRVIPPDEDYEFKCLTTPTE